MPALQARLHLFSRTLEFLRMSILEFAAGELLPVASLFHFRGALLGGERGFFFRVDGDEHLLYAAQIGDAVFGETAGEEGARGVFAGEEVVGATGSVGRGRDGDVVDCAVEGEVDGLGGVAAVVVGEFGVREGDLALLFGWLVTCLVWMRVVD